MERFHSSLTSMRSIPPVSWFAVAVVLVAIGIMGQNLLLLRENRSLRSAISGEVHREIKLGEALPAFGGVNLEGRFITLDLAESQRRHLLISFSTTCPACHLNLENWLKLASMAGSGWDVVWLSRDPLERTKQYCREKGIRGQVLSEFSCRAYNRLGLALVPRTIAVDAMGRVEKVWVGELSSQIWPDLFRHFAQG